MDKQNKLDEVILSKLLKLFRVTSLSEAVFIIILAMMVIAVIVISYIQHNQQYHHFYFNNFTPKQDEVFIKKVGTKTLLVVKDTDPRSQYPRVHYKVLEGNKTLYGSSIVVGEFEPFPNEIIFEDRNGTLEYVDQYKKPYEADISLP